MAILSSLFGAQQQQPAVGAQPITVTTEIPEQLKPYYTDILSKAQALYNKRVEEGFNHMKVQLLLNLLQSKNNLCRYSRITRTSSS